MRPCWLCTAKKGYPSVWKSCTGYADHKHIFSPKLASVVGVVVAGSVTRHLILQAVEDLCLHKMADRLYSNLQKVNQAALQGARPWSNAP
jgi:hypothetical protein